MKHLLLIVLCAFMCIGQLDASGINKLILRVPIFKPSLSMFKSHESTKNDLKTKVSVPLKHIKRVKKGKLEKVLDCLFLLCTCACYRYTIHFLHRN